MALFASWRCFASLREPYFGDLQFIVSGKDAKIRKDAKNQWLFEIAPASEKLMFKIGYSFQSL